MKKMFLLGLLGISILTTKSLAKEQRIVLLGGAVAEIVSALGQEKYVVGVDLSCTWPESLRDKPKVGYYRQVPSEGILSLKPTLVLASGASGPPSAMKQIEKAGVKIVRLDPANSPEALLSNIRTVGKALDEAAASDILVKQTESQLASVRLKNKELSTIRQPLVLFIMTNGGAGNLMAAGHDTAADALINLAGGKNVFFQAKGYKPLGQESLAGLKPDVVLLPAAGAHGSATSMLMDNVALQNCPAVTNGRVYEIDMGKFLSFGTRLPEALRELQSHFFPTDSKPSAAP
jgi:iron complex transport system substrate-binding protein